jgi:hypothetical protein
MQDFPALVIGGVPLMVVIFGLVEFSKKLGLSGKGLTIFSMLLGIVFGITYQFSMRGFPSDIAGWFAVLVYGLALGLVTSGFYDFANNRLPSAIPPEPK